MRDTKLILVDGINGSGKSTTSDFLASQIARAGHPVTWLLEEQAEHPLHVGTDLEMAVSPQEFCQIYPPEIFVKETIRKWQEFVDRAIASPAITIIDSYPFQSTSGLLLLMDADKELIRSAEQCIEKILQPLRPVMIYFDQPNAAQAVKTTCEQRGRAWTHHFVNETTKFPYVRNRQLDAFVGLFQYANEYKTLVDEMLIESTIPSLILHNAAADWPKSYQDILNFLELPSHIVQATDRELKRFSGTYKDEDTGQEYRVYIEDGTLYIDNLWFIKLKLAYRGRGVFFMSGREFEFQEERSGRIGSLRVAGKPLYWDWPLAGKVLVRQRPPKTTTTTIVLPPTTPAKPAPVPLLEDLLSVQSKRSAR